MNLQIFTLTGDSQVVEVVQSSFSDLIWTSKQDELRIEIRLGEAGKIEFLEIDPQIASSRDEISNQFLNAYSQIVEQEAAGVEFLDISNDESFEPFPYDPDAIRVDTKQFNIGLIHEMINDGDINLSPDFQRQFVWTDLGSRSRLIESIMLRIPLPVFYMAQDGEGRLHVVDGLQRLTVINQFLNSELRLRDLEYLKEEIGKVFRHEDPMRCINQKYRKRILQTQIMVNIIDPQTPSEVKFDIFKRINQGGRPLNAQEMRNCMSMDYTRELITSLAKSNDFLRATDASVGTVRMQDQELVLRFIAFRLMKKNILPQYPGNMEVYLNKTIETLNNNPNCMESLVIEFEQAMRNSYYLFGEFAFRKCTPQDIEPGKRRRLINNSYFTTWSSVLADYDDEFIRKIPEGSMSMLLAKTLEADDEFRDAVSSGTNDRRRLEYAFGVTNRLCAEVFG